MIHGLELPIQTQDLVKAYQTSTCFSNIYNYITNGKLPSGAVAQSCTWAEALTCKDKDRDKGNSFLLVILEKYKPIIFNTCHNSLLAGHQSPYRTVMTIGKYSLFMT